LSTTFTPTTEIACSPPRHRPDPDRAAAMDCKRKVSQLNFFLICNISSSENGNSLKKSSSRPGARDKTLAKH